MPKDKSPLATLEADLAALVKRRDALEKRRTEAAGVLTTATAERRRLLVEQDSPPAASLDKADRACRDAADADASLVDALAEIDSRIAGLRDRIERLTTAEARDREAAAVEVSAGAAEAALDRIRKAAAEIDAARADLAEAILPTAAACYAPASANPHPYGPGTLSTTYVAYDGDRIVSDLPPAEVALRLAGHALAAVLPGLAITTWEEASTLRGNGLPTPVLSAASDADAVRVLLTDPMRKHAADLRSGAATVLPAAPAKSRSDIATDQPPLRPAMYKVDLQGNMLDMDGRPLDLVAELDEVMA